MQYQAMAAPEDQVGCNTILGSLEKRWLAADQNIFIATVIVNPLYRTTPFTAHPHFMNACVKSLLALLYLRFFKMHAPNDFYMELHDFLMGSGQYSELKVMCDRHLYSSTHKVYFFHICLEMMNADLYS